MLHTTCDESGDDILKHYILVLDDSGSMEGRSWSGLLEAVTKFITEKETNFIAHRLSCIKFSSKSKIIFENEVLDKKLARHPGLIFESGGTEFSLAVAHIVEILDRYPAYPNVVLFMSDGRGMFPLNMPDLSKVWKQDNLFYAIGFGRNDEFDELKKMAEHMGGQFKNPRDIEELVDTYAEIAQNS